MDTGMALLTPQRACYQGSGIGLTPVTEEMLLLQLSSGKKMGTRRSLQEEEKFSSPSTSQAQSSRASPLMGRNYGGQATDPPTDRGLQLAGQGKRSICGGFASGVLRR